MSRSLFSDIKAWRGLARLMPGWRPTLRGLQRLDEGPNELLVALRAVARDWGPDDARWDVLQGVLEYYKRQHAHELAERQRADALLIEDEGDCCRKYGLALARSIDPEVLNSGE